MTVLSILLFLIILGVAALHALWATGSSFPAKNRKQLHRSVIGFRGPDVMPPAWMSALVAALILFSGLSALVLGGVIYLPKWIAIIIGLLVMLAYLARGVAGYTKGWRELTPKKPFHRLDRLYYSPFCLVVGLGFLVLIFGNLI